MGAEFLPAHPGLSRGPPPSCRKRQLQLEQRGGEEDAALLPVLPQGAAHRGAGRTAPGGAHRQGGRHGDHREGQNVPVPCCHPPSWVTDAPPGAAPRADRRLERQRLVEPERLHGGAEGGVGHLPGDPLLHRVRGGGFQKLQQQRHPGGHEGLRALGGAPGGQRAARIAPLRPPQVDQSGLFLPSRDYYLNRTANERVRGARAPPGAGAVGGPGLDPWVGASHGWD